MQLALTADWEKYGYDKADRTSGKDISFEETLRRHQTKPNCASFGAKEMRRWWREKDFSTVLQEVSINDEKDMQSIVAEIYHIILNEEED